ncbi:hypothetical protein GQX74_012456 [Glossina fuscipes]|nr:hypothetical protein GQX74_012456 [Glossina fuscipes]
MKEKQFLKNGLLVRLAVTKRPNERNVSSHYVIHRTSQRLLIALMSALRNQNYERFRASRSPPGQKKSEIPVRDTYGIGVSSVCEHKILVFVAASVIISCAGMLWN